MVMPVPSPWSCQLQQDLEHGSPVHARRGETTHHAVVRRGLAACEPRGAHGGKSAIVQRVALGNRLAALGHGRGLMRSQPASVFRGMPPRMCIALSGMAPQSVRRHKIGSDIPPSPARAATPGALRTPLIESSPARGASVMEAGAASVVEAGHCGRPVWPRSFNSSSGTRPSGMPVGALSLGRFRRGVSVEDRVSGSVRCAPGSGLSGCMSPTRRSGSFQPTDGLLAARRRR